MEVAPRYKLLTLLTLFFMFSQFPTTAFQLLGYLFTSDSFDRQVDHRIYTD